MRRRRKFIIAGVVIALALGFLLYRAFSSFAMYYYEVNEVQAKASLLYDEDIRVRGTVSPDSITYDQAGRTVRFVVLDAQLDGVSLPAVFQGVVPDTFKPGAEVVMEGRYTTAGVFEATRLQAKCPSKYSPI